MRSFYVRNSIKRSERNENGLVVSRDTNKAAAFLLSFKIASELIRRDSIGLFNKGEKMAAA